MSVSSYTPTSKATDQSQLKSEGAEAGGRPGTGLGSAFAVVECDAAKELHTGLREESDRH